MSTRRSNICRASVLLSLMMVLGTPAMAVTQLKRQMDAPAIALKDTSGNAVSTADLKGRILIVVFGELYHEKTREAYDAIEVVLRDERFKGQMISPMVVVAQAVGAEDLKNYGGKAKPSTILLDPDRKAFGAYQVTAMPSVVVIDKNGQVVHAFAGLSNRFSDTVTDCLLHATGRLSAKAFEETLNPHPTTAPSETQVRGERMSLLARQLSRRGMEDLAIEKYVEALNVDAQQITPRLELGTLLLNKRRLAEAEQQFRTVLAAMPSSQEAKLGVAYVQTLRGGKELGEAELTLREVLARNGSNARAHYLLGLIQEQRGKIEEATLSFKKAAQLLLEHREQEQP